jgi:prophage regulatory protein
MLKMKLLKLKQVMELTTMSRTTIYREISYGDFPKQACLGKSNSVWLESEVVDYLLVRFSNR